MRRYMRAVICLVLTLPLTLSAAAQYPLVFIPAVDASDWEVEIGEGVYAPIDVQNAWLAAEISDGGAMILRHTEIEKSHTWPRLRTRLPTEGLVTVDLTQTPYVIYDFTFTGPGRWMISLYFENCGEVRMANAITMTAGLDALEGENPDLTDGRAGTYKGTIDLNEWAARWNVYGFESGGSYTLQHMNIFLVRAEADTEMIVRTLRLDSQPGAENTQDTETASNPEEDHTLTSNPEQNPEGIAESVPVASGEFDTGAMVVTLAFLLAVGIAANVILTKRRMGSS